MQHDKANASDELTSTLTPGAPTKGVKVEVVSGEGLTKNGTHYAKGEKLELHPLTAANFIKSGDVKEAK